MAAPRVFVSSTFFDLRHVRSDLERFIKELGFEPVLHERGAIAYGHDEALDEYAYREVELCDILVSIVGGRFGTKSSRDDRSISQTELRAALKLGKQVYVFVERNVHAEFRTWEINRDSPATKYASVDNPKIFEFLHEVYALPNNNPITAFENAADIAIFLQRQWAGLFQRFLTTANTAEQHRSIEKLHTAVATLERLVNVWGTQQQRAPSEVVEAILLREHPVFGAIKKHVGMPFVPYFYTLEELRQVLLAYRFEDHEDEDSEGYHQWRRTQRAAAKGKATTQFLLLDKSLFDEKLQLQPFNVGAWKEEYVELITMEQPPAKSPFDGDDDDLPF